MKPEAQSAVAIFLRRAIWNWIETFPNEFVDMANGHRKLDGAPERVFDLFLQIKNDHNRKIMWPVLTALIILSHDRMKAVTAELDGHTFSARQVQNKKVCIYIIYSKMDILNQIFRSLFSWRNYGGASRTMLKRRNQLSSASLT